MAQIHALLLVSDDALSAEDIMRDLNLSRGNVNMNLRELINWGLVQKELISGERREFFSAEKDIWKISRLIARERRKRELEPALKVLDELRAIKDADPATKRFKSKIDEIYKISSMVDSMIGKFINSSDNWLMRLFKFILK
jgi:DNA-binding transcriptional regulator GbsR (MarR family)